MIDGEWRRARNPEQRAERERQILGAAERLFAGLPYERVTMQMVARETGISQSNLYRYFSTREEMFLRLFTEDLRRWLEDILTSLGSGLSVSAFSERWTGILLRHERLLELHPHLALSLERNASETVYRNAKRSFLALIERGLPVLKAALPFRDDRDVLAFLETHLALTAGLFPMSKYSPMQRSVLLDPELSPLKIDFAIAYRNTIETYLNGLFSP